MSFPSIAIIAKQRGLTLATLCGKDAEEVLLAAVRQDCPEAIEYLHQKAHEAEHGPVLWSEDPNSVLGKQLIRIHASDAVRPLIESHVCHGEQLVFVNCCNGTVGGDKKEFADLVRLQLECQAGPIAYADC